MKILFSNIGYAKDIDGSLAHHVFRASRHLFCPVPVQMNVLGQVRALIDAEQPELCCFVEIDSGSFSSRYLDHMELLLDEAYPFYDVADKYGESGAARMPFMEGKSNGFMARGVYDFARLYLAHGVKRLLYRIQLAPDITVFFGHFSLQQKTRRRQFEQLRDHIKSCVGEVMVLADFNVLTGFDELAPLCADLNLRILNDSKAPTFRLHRQQLALDLCLCSSGIGERAKLKIVPQPYSDHAALIVEV